MRTVRCSTLGRMTWLLEHYVRQRTKEKGPLRVLSPCSDAESYLLLPPLRPGLPGTPPSSSFERRGLPWFELPGSQDSAPLPTPWLQCFFLLGAGFGIPA